jgi:mercuric ion binding protein
MYFFTKLVVLALLPSALAFADESQIAVMDLHNIQCYGCLNTVKKALQQVPGVEDTKLDLEKKTVTVKFDRAKTNTEALVRATAKAGFPSTVRK